MNNDHGIHVRRPWETGGQDLAIAPPEPWTEIALCLQADPEMFFPEKGGSTAEAKAICQRCEVRQECLEFALRTESHSAYSTYGVYGGLSAKERTRLMTRRAS